MLKKVGISFLLFGACCAIPRGQKANGPSDESLRRAKEILDKTPIIDG